MNRSKIFDCITFFDNNFMFEIRYNILSQYVDYFVICESKFDHRGNKKEKNFIWKENFDKKKIKYLLIDSPFPTNTNIWENQAIQREELLNFINFAGQEDYIFFSDPDEIVRPELLENSECAKVLNFKEISFGVKILLKCHPPSLNNWIFFSLSNLKKL